MFAPGPFWTARALGPLVVLDRLRQTSGPTHLDQPARREYTDEL